MSTLEAVRPTVTPLGMPRTLAGRFAANDARDGVRPVLLPTGVVAWQVGPTGRIYAHRPDAVAAAARRVELAGRRREEVRRGEVDHALAILGGAYPGSTIDEIEWARGVLESA